MAEIFRIVADHQGSDVDPGRLKPVGQIVEVFWSTGDAVIPNDGIGQDQNLAFVGRICQRLGVADHAWDRSHRLDKAWAETKIASSNVLTGLKNAFSGNAFALCAKTDPAEDRSICEVQGGVFRRDVGG